MHEPESFDPSRTPSEPSGTASYEAAMEKVRAVLAWYSEQITAEQRAAEPDTARRDQLIEDRRACIDDQRALREADPDEVARIAAHYEALFQQLTQP